MNPRCSVRSVILLCCCKVNTILCASEFYVEPSLLQVTAKVVLMVFCPCKLKFCHSQTLETADASSCEIYGKRGPMGLFCPLRFSDAGRHRRRLCGALRLEAGGPRGPFVRFRGIHTASAAQAAQLWLQAAQQRPSRSLAAQQQPSRLAAQLWPQAARAPIGPQLAHNRTTEFQMQKNEARYGLLHIFPGKTLKTNSELRAAFQNWRASDQAVQRPPAVLGRRAGGGRSSVSFPIALLRACGPAAAQPAQLRRLWPPGGPAAQQQHNSGLQPFCPFLSSRTASTQPLRRWRLGCRSRRPAAAQLWSPGGPPATQWQPTPSSSAARAAQLRPAVRAAGRHRHFCGVWGPTAQPWDWPTVAQPCVGLGPQLPRSITQLSYSCRAL